MPWLGKTRDADVTQSSRKCDYGCGLYAVKAVRIEPSREMVLLCARHYGLAKCNLSAVLAKRAGWPRDNVRTRRMQRNANVIDLTEAQARWLQQALAGLWLPFQLMILSVVQDDLAERARQLNAGVR